MIGIDTNVLIRWLVSDPVSQEQSNLAAEVFESAREDVLICPVVLAELAWVLDSRFRFRREQVATVLKTLLESPTLRFENRKSVESAVEAFIGGRADFSDYVIAALNFAAGCKTTMTFDKTAAKGAQFTLLH